MNFFEKIIFPLRKLKPALLGSGWRGVPECDVLLMCHDCDRYAMVEGVKYSPILDSFADNQLLPAGLICARIATPFSVKVGKSAWGHPYHFNTEMWLASLPKSPLRETFTFRNLVGKIIRRTRCKAIIAIDVTPELCKCCHDNGVLCIEIAHGMGYTSFDYKYGGCDTVEIPDAFICYDDVSANAWHEMTGNSQSVWRTSHPWFSRFNEGGDCAGGFLPASLITKMGDFKKIVLVSLQWSYDGEDERLAGIIHNGIMTEELERAILETQGDVLWLVRLHPIQMEGPRYAKHRKYVDALSRRTTNVFGECSKLPLPLLLSHSHGHVTMSSMVCYEASWIGVPSIAMCPTLLVGGLAHDVFDDLVVSNFVQKTGLSYEKLCQWLVALDTSKKERHFNSFEDSGVGVAIAKLCTL
jgi:hypothetical protein